MKFGFMAEHQGIHSVEKMARVFTVSRSGFYAWRRRARSEREVRDSELAHKIWLVQEKTHYRYGSPRVTVQLARRGYQVGHNHVARLMRENGLGARCRRRFRSTTDSNHGHPVAPNILGRRFDICELDVAWVSDITFVSTAEGWMYLCIIMDVASRKIVGWSLDKRMKADLVVDAPMMAIIHRGPPRGVIFHSDRGSQYCSGKVRRRLESYGFIQSMSRKGNCWDNAPAESFFKTLKNELWGYRAFATREIARTAIFEYIEVFYNRQRLHSSLGYITPVEFEESRSRKVA